MAVVPDAGGDIKKICNHLFNEVKKKYSEDKKLSNDLLSVLQFVFQGPLLAALELVEKEAVTQITSQNKRELFQVIGTSGTPYMCFPSLRYCSCPAYHYSVLKNEEYIMCKHVLAAHMAVSMDTVKHMTLSDEEVSKLIQDMD